jgi:hypothetical protein
MIEQTTDISKMFLKFSTTLGKTKFIFRYFFSNGAQAAHLLSKASWPIV